MNDGKARVVWQPLNARHTWQLILATVITAPLVDAGRQLGSNICSGT